MKLSLEELINGTGGRALSTHATSFNGVGTDSRADLTGEVFIALKGDNFDAHDFLIGAVQQGAAALLVHTETPAVRELAKTVTVVVVEDTLLGLQRLGTFWRRKMKARILALSGSNGKTTTKEFAAAVIGTKRKVHYSKGSLNNHWGVPLSLLAIEPEHEVAVIEMGMNHPGELTVLSKIAEPDVILVTMVGRGHLEGLGSIEGVAKAKAEMYEAASPQATLGFNVANEYTRKMFEKFGQKRQAPVLTFGGSQSDANLEVVGVQTEQQMTVRGQIGGVKGEATVPVFGAHNVTNLMAAAIFALTVGMKPEEIWSALPLCHTVWGRNQWVGLASGARVLFDGYNANPESMGAAIANFAQLAAQGRKYAVLGEMKEMGEHAEAAHRELGEEVARAGFEEVCFFGPSQNEFAAGLKAGGFSKKPFLSNAYEQSLAARMLPVLKLGDLVLMKGSRGMHLEQALLALKPLDFALKK